MRLTVMILATFGALAIATSAHSGWAVLLMMVLLAILARWLQRGGHRG